MWNREQFISRIAAFRERHELTPSDFSHLAVGDRSWLAAFVKGRDIRVSTVERVDAFMAEKDAELRRETGTDVDPAEAAAALLGTS